jgi:CrcB protein
MKSIVERGFQRRVVGQRVELQERSRIARAEAVLGFYTWLIIAFGGAIGSLLRYGVSVLALPISQTLPWGTIIINVLGSFIIGFFGTLTLANGKYPVSENVRLFVMVGLCGGFTTFSAFSLQTLDLIREGSMLRAGANIILSVTLCVCAVASPA